MEKNEELEKAVTSLSEDGISLALLSREPDVCYVSGYAPSYQNGPFWPLIGPDLALVGNEAPEGWLLWPKGSPTKGEVEHTKVLHRLASSVEYIPFEHFKPYDGIDNYLNAVFSMLQHIGIANNSSLAIGMQLNYLPFFVVEAIRKNYPKIRFIDATPAMDRARRKKTEREVRLIKEAVSLSDIAHRALQEYARKGITEIELWSQVEKQIIQHAGHRVQVIMELVSGPRTSTVNFPWGPTNREINDGDTLIMDILIRHQGYWTDCTNSFCVGFETPEFNHCFKAAMQGLESGVELLKPNVRACDVEAAIRKCLEQNGFRAWNYLGHQVGTSPCEAPMAVVYNDDKIESDMVYCLEPGAYMGEGGKCGVRLEPVCLITDHGAEMISNFKFGR
jgi:Xaa-Pro aminopeptidase